MLTFLSRAPSANDPVFQQSAVVPFAKPPTFLDRLLVEELMRPIAAYFRARPLATLEEATHRALEEDRGLVTVDIELLGETIDERCRD